MPRAVITPLYSVLVRHIWSAVSGSGLPRTKEADTAMLEPVQQIYKRKIATLPLQRPVITESQVYWAQDFKQAAQHKHSRLIYDSGQNTSVLQVKEKCFCFTSVMTTKPTVSQFYRCHTVISITLNRFKIESLGKKKKYPLKLNFDFTRIFAFLQLKQSNTKTQLLLKL